MWLRCTLALSVTAGAGPALDPVLTGFPAGSRDGFVAYEAALNAVPASPSLRGHHELLGSEPHVASSEGDARNIERLVKAFGDMGLEVQRHDFWAYLARPVAAELAIVAPEPLPLLVKEYPVAEDAYSADARLDPGWNAYSGNGDVTAGVVYANYGTKADFAKLAELKVDVRGKIVLARYGGNFRGYKAKFAEQAGAAGLIIYTDPADSGYMKGLLYPEGGWSNECCIQRGSIAALNYSGDPLTPGREATEDAPRLDPAQVALPTIPVQPIGWGAAREIMMRMAGAPVPDGWQGGLPVPYRLTGGDTLTVRLHVEQERRIARSSNVVATLRGALSPDQKVVIGCHHDAWGFGAADPLAGTMCLLESARSFTELARAGQRPARTIVFAAWGAEEFGIIGSTEWVEANADDLTRRAVAYINLDMAAMGADFGSSATSSLRRVIAEAARTVPQARGASGQTVFDAWLARGPDAVAPGQPQFGDIGGGSDHVAFLCHAGVPSLTLGSNGSKGNAYHSAYDTIAWYRKVVGEDYEPALMVTRMTNAVAARLASCPVVPIDPARCAPDARRHLVGLTSRAVALDVWPRPDLDIAPELARLEGATVQYGHLARDVDERLTRAVEAGKLSPASLERINELLIALDRAWIDAVGVPGRPWYRNLAVAPDEDSGYASWPLPALRAAVERKDKQAITWAEERYLRIFQQLTSIVGLIDSTLRVETGDTAP